MTRKELRNYIEYGTKVIQGYCEYSNLPYEEKKKFVKIGTNCGTYGWNWTAYKNPVDNVLIVDGYRNFI